VAGPTPGATAGGDGNGQGHKKDEGVIDAEYVDVEEKKLTTSELATDSRGSTRIKIIRGDPCDPWLAFEGGIEWIFRSMGKLIF